MFSEKIENLPVEYLKVFRSFTEEEQKAIDLFLCEKGEVINALFNDELRKSLVVDYQNAIWSLEERLNRDFEPVLARKLLSEFNRILKDPEYWYDDNWRYAEVGDEEQEARYNEMRRKGCCGFYDSVVKVEGRMFKIGFNYGH